MHKRLHELKKEQQALGTISAYVRFFVDIVLKPTFLTDLNVFENCLIKFKKDSLKNLRQIRAARKEELMTVDQQLKNMLAKWTQSKSDELNNSIDIMKCDKKKLSSEINELNSQIDILDLTVDKFWDEIFSTYDWIIEKEKLNSDLIGPSLKAEIELFKSQIDSLIDRYIELIEHGFSVHILRGKPLKIKSQALKKVFEKLKSNEELLIITMIGEQSSAKSSLLNAMFGCDFRTSAGRCTVGIYMNFVRYKVNIILHFKNVIN